MNCFVELQLVFERVNHFNNSKVKETLKKDEFFKRKNYIFGIADIIDEIKNDPEVRISQ